MGNTNECIAIFLKYPQPGKVKTRLAGTIGKLNAAELYLCMVEDTLEAARKSRRHIDLFYSPGRLFERFKKWLGGGYGYFPQRGRNLGTRMKNAFKTLFAKGYRYVVLIGSDLPGIDSGTLSRAFRELQEVGVVLGPSGDGGYYLIGFSKEAFCGNVFNDIPWGTTAVFKETIEILKKQKTAFKKLHTMRDIDKFSDLSRFINNPKNKKLKTAVKINSSSMFKKHFKFL